MGVDDYDDQDGVSPPRGHPAWDSPPDSVYADLMAQANHAEPEPISNVVQMPRRDDAKITATPFTWRDPSSIPARPWVWGRWLLRGTAAAIVAPGGVGKSTFAAAGCLSLATGQPLLGKDVWNGPKRVWYWNLEDDADELDRQFHAAAMLYDIRPEDVQDRLFVDSGLGRMTADGLEGAARLCVAEDINGEFRIIVPVVEALIAELIAREIDVLWVDPFVSSHQVDENNNSKIDAVAKLWAMVAVRARCVVALTHHTKKLAGQKVTAEMSRGAVSLIAAARTTLVLNRMDEAEAKQFQIVDDAERRRYFSVQDDKHNRAPAENAAWFRIASIDLGNRGDDGHSDNVGVVTAWTPPDPFEGLTGAHLYRVQKAISEGRWRENVQAKDWVGLPIAAALMLDHCDDRAKAKIKVLIKEWLKNGSLVRVEGKDANHIVRTFIEVGEWAQV